MSKTIAVISYDLKKVDNSHVEFIKEMKVLLWRFSLDGNDLPNTTCWASYLKPISEENAKDFAIKDINTVVAKLTKSIPGFEIEKYYVIAFKQPTSVVEVWPKK